MLEKKLDENLQDQNQKSPARLTTDIRLQLHTRIAQSLFNGSWKHGKMGLLQFAKVTTELWNAAKEDDPYAEWYLLKTYQTLVEAREQIKLIELTLTNHLSKMRGIEINLCMSTHPINHPLKFATPFAFMGAYLVADVDYVLRQLLTLERIGVSLHKENISIKQMVTYVQGAFSMPRRWRRTFVTRQDIHENNHKATQAKELLGDVPESVLKSQIEFAFLPKKHKDNTHV